MAIKPNKFFTALFMVMMLIAVQRWIQIVTFNIWLFFFYLAIIFISYFPFAYFYTCYAVHFLHFDRTQSAIFGCYVWDAQQRRSCFHCKVLQQHSREYQRVIFCVVNHIWIWVPTFTCDEIMCRNSLIMLQLKIFDILIFKLTIDMYVTF